MFPFLCVGLNVCKSWQFRVTTGKRANIVTVMGKRLFLSLLSVLVLGAVSLMAADVSGKWAAEVQGRNGQTRNMTFSFKQDGSTLTGSMVGPMGREFEISNGTVDGDNLSFYVKMEFQGNAMKIHYTGTVEGDSIKMKSQREGSERVQEFTAKKSQ